MTGLLLLMVSMIWLLPAVAQRRQRVGAGQLLIGLVGPLGPVRPRPQHRFAGLPTIAAFLALPVGLVLALQAPVVAVAGAGVVLGHRRVARRRREARGAEVMVAALPLAIELCVVVLGAGGTIADCLRALDDGGPPVLASPTRRALAAAGQGLPLDGALRQWRSELGPAFQPLTGALLLAWEQGGSVGALLDRLAVETAAARRRHSDLRARRLPVLLLLPLVGCSLPAVIIGALVPVALVAFTNVVP